MATIQSTGTIYISNISEDVWSFISTMSSAYSKKFEIQENAQLSEHDLFNFFEMNHCLIILPSNPDKNYYKYFLSLSKNKNFKTVATKIHTGEICKDILNDYAVMKEIKRITSQYDKVNLISYSSSDQFIKLSSFLQQNFRNIILSESPSAADSWTVDFYGSKSGIRQLSQQYDVQEPDFKMAEGLISVGIENTAKIAANLFLKNGGIVIKTNKGHSGAGILIYRSKDLPNNFQNSEKILLKNLQKEIYWSRFPIILEKYIEPNYSIGGGYPNVEFKIHKNGRVEFLYYCACRITEKGVFKGIEIHKDVLSDKVSAQLIDTGFFLGEKYAKGGYRGYFDIDFIAAKNNILYVTESNVRRTGGTHVYYLAKALYGKNFMHKIYTLSNNLYELKSKTKINSKTLYTLLKPLLFNQNKMEGCIITGTSLLKQNAFGYVIFAKTKSKALKFESEMERLLSSN